MRVALFMTHKRIMAKTSGRRSIDADIKPARFIGYCWIIAPHNVEHFFLLLIRFNPGKFFSSMLVGIFEFNFPHISHFLIVRMFLYAAVRFLSLPIFTGQVDQLASCTCTLTEEMQHVILFYFARAFLGGSCDSEVSKHLPSVPFIIQQNSLERFTLFELCYQSDSKGIKGILLL